MLDRSMPPHQAGLPVNHQRRSKQHVHSDNPADVGECATAAAMPSRQQGSFHVGFQLPAFRAARACNTWIDCISVVRCGDVPPLV